MNYCGRLLRTALTSAAGAVLVLLLSGPPAAAADKNKPYKFDVAVRPDPFSDLNATTTPLDKLKFRRGTTLQVSLTCTMDKGWHTYPVENLLPGQQYKNELHFLPNPALKPFGRLIESAPERITKDGDTLNEYPKSATWTQEILVLPEAQPGKTELKFVLRITACTDQSCLPAEDVTFVIPLEISDAKALTPPTPPDNAVTPTRGGDKEQPGATGTEPTRRADDTGTPAASAAAVIGDDNPANGGLLLQLGLAAGAGFLMLLTPCVFPMIPVTVSFFLKQSEKKISPIGLATVYSGTIFVLLSAAVLLLGKVIIDLANNPWLNLAMGALMLLFALSLFGMYELELPGFLTRFTSKHEGQGYIGAFFMALTFTVNSFTCTGPFLGPLLAGLKTFGQSYTEVVLSALVYSAAFAGPFFLLALFPGLLKALPKSGGWLNSVKVVMGFLELALAVKFLSITDADWFPGEPRIFTYDAVLAAWIMLSVACGLYLLGLFRLPHDSPVDSIGVPRLLLATAFLGLGLYLMPLLWRKPPQGVVGEFASSMLPLDSREELGWTRDYKAAYEQARKEKKLLLVDFTGMNCVNCRYNEQNVFTRPEVRAEMAKYVRVQLYTDTVPDASLPKDEAERRALTQRDWQERTIGDISLPTYVVIDPSRGGPEAVSPDGKLNGVVRFKAKGKINDVGGFVKGLKEAQSGPVASR